MTITMMPSDIKEMLNKCWWNKTEIPLLNLPSPPQIPYITGFHTLLTAPVLIFLSRHLDMVLARFGLSGTNNCTARVTREHKTEITVYSSWLIVRKAFLVFHTYSTKFCSSSYIYPVIYPTFQTIPCFLYQTAEVFWDANFNHLKSCLLFLITHYL